MTRKLHGQAEDRRIEGLCRVIADWWYDKAWAHGSKSQISDSFLFVYG
jgi:hypothetical protein